MELHAAGEGIVRVRQHVPSRGGGRSPTGQFVVRRRVRACGIGHHRAVSHRIVHECGAGAVRIVAISELTVGIVEIGGPVAAGVGPGVAGTVGVVGEGLPPLQGGDLDGRVAGRIIGGRKPVGPLIDEGDRLTDRIVNRRGTVPQRIDLGDVLPGGIEQSATLWAAWENQMPTP